MSGFQSCWAQGFYSLWRSKRLLVFTWYGRLGLQAPLLALRTNLAGVRHFLPDFVLYSLPDALWVYSFTFLMQSVWFRHSKSYGRTFWILLPVSLAVGAEVGQLIKVVPGTFDLKDIAGYIAAWAAATMFIRTCCTRDEVTSVDICRFVTRKLGDLQTLLAGEPAEARRERHKHVSEIRMVPQAGEGSLTMWRSVAGICWEMSKISPVPAIFLLRKFGWLRGLQPHELAIDSMRCEF